MSLYHMFSLSEIIANLYICSVLSLICSSFHIPNNGDINNLEKQTTTIATGNSSNGFRGVINNSYFALSNYNSTSTSPSYYLPLIEQTTLKTIYKSNFLFPSTITNFRKVTTKYPTTNLNSNDNYYQNKKRIRRNNKDLLNKNVKQVKQNQQQQNKEQLTATTTTTTFPSIINGTLENEIENNSIKLNNSSKNDSDLTVKDNDLTKKLSAQIINNLDISNKDDSSLNLINDKRISINRLNNYYNNDIVDDNLNDNDDLEKIETHINNHHSLNTITSNSRHYNNYNPIKFNSNNHNLNYNNNNYINKYSINSNSFSNNINLNYIHSLLTSANNNNNNFKPISINTGNLQPSSITSMLNSNLYTLTIPTNNFQLQQPNPITLTQQQQQEQPTTSDILSTSSSSSSTTTNSNNNNSQQQNFLHLNNNINDNTFSINPLMQQQCGKQQVGYREPRIVGGNSTFEGEFPWAVSIQRHGNHHCGGTIISSRHILTAAHCVRSQLAGNLIVKTGGHTLNRNINNINSHLERDYFVEQIIMHNDFTRYDNSTSSSHFSSLAMITNQLKSASAASTNNADIAILKLRDDILWNEFTWPICLPPKESGNFSDHEAIVIGWGKLNEKSEEFSNLLQKTKITVLDQALCKSWFKQAGREIPINDATICAGLKNGAGGKDACHGDSGGPLMVRGNNNRYWLIGLVSTGVGCARPKLPGLYTRVTSYLNWINDNIK